MAGAHVEYVGFKAGPAGREYALRVWVLDGEPQGVTLVIPNEAFLSRRLRYQDAPEVCFLKLQRELAACPDGRLAARWSITDAELEDYRQAHLPKAPRRSRPQQPEK